VQHKITQLRFWPTIYMHRHCDRIFGDFPAKNTVCTPYILYLWFWPTLHMILQSCPTEVCMLHSMVCMLVHVGCMLVHVGARWCMLVHVGVQYGVHVAQYVQLPCSRKTRGIYYGISPSHLICAYVCICVCLCLHMCVQAYVCAYLCAYVCAYVCLCVHMCVLRCVQAYVSAYVCASIRIPRTSLHIRMH